MKISIVLPVYNASATIKSCLDSILSQRFSPYEIICAYSVSTDNTLEILREYKQKHPVIKIVEGQKKGPAFSRNNGLKKVTGELVTFTDSDCVLPEYWLDLIVHEFEKEQIDALTGPVLGIDPETIYDKYLGIMGLNIIHENEIYDEYEVARTFGHTSNLAVKKSVLDVIGNFKDYLLTGEDHDICARIINNNFKLKFCSYLVVNHIFRSTFKHFTKQTFSFSYAHGYLFKHHSKPSILIRKDGKKIFEKEYKLHIWLEPFSLIKKNIYLIFILYLLNPVFIFLIILYWYKIYRQISRKFTGENLKDTLKLFAVHFWYNILSEIGNISGAADNNILIL